MIINGFPLTDEQKKACHMALPKVHGGELNNLKISAFAGAGKTSTLLAIAHLKQKEKGLYLCYNKDIKEEASSKFPGNVKCLTNHALAYPHTAIYLKHKLFGAGEWVRVEKLLSGVNLKGFHDLTPRSFARIVKKTVERFTQSGSFTIQKGHIEKVDYSEYSTVIPRKRTKSQQDLFVDLVIEQANRYWNILIDAGNNVKISHDVYLKLFQLSKPVLNYDFILFDEAQDANPVILDIIQRQKHIQVILVGDRHQAIYGWRGARNAMESFPAKECFLTRSFRFGEKVAQMANSILEKKGETMKIKGFKQIKSQINKSINGKPFTYLFRTNAGIIQKAFECSEEQKSYFIAGRTTIEQVAEQILSLYYLYANKPYKIKDELILSLGSWNRFIDYIQEESDPELERAAKLIKKHKHDTPGKVDELMRYAVKDERKADIVMTTGHKSKGLEWPIVAIGEDFTLKGKKGKLADDETINLVYVAITRAQKNLILNSELNDLYHGRDSLRIQ